MRIILDTNVLVSGIFFTGPPSRILRELKDGKLRLVMSPGILHEYQRVAEALAAQFPGVSLGPMLNFLSINAESFSVQPLSEAVCQDPDDDKFIACALAAKCKVIVSGDKHLLRVSGFRGIQIVKPRAFADQYLTSGRNS